MGGLFSSCCAQKTHSLILVGLDAAGKTTWLYRLQTGEHRRTFPTIVSNFEEIVYKNVKLSVWDLGGQASHRSLWKYHFQGAKGLLFAVDSSDRQRMPEAKRELLELLEDDKLQDSIIIVLANKQDVPDSMSAQEVAEILSLDDVLGPDRPWFVQPTSAMCGEGVHEAMDWVLANLGKGGGSEGGTGKRGVGLLVDKARHYPEEHLKVAASWRARQLAEDDDRHEHRRALGTQQHALESYHQGDASAGVNAFPAEPVAHELNKNAKATGAVVGASSVSRDDLQRDPGMLQHGLESDVPPSPSSSSIQAASSSSSVRYVVRHGEVVEEQDTPAFEDAGEESGGDLEPNRPALVHAGIAGADARTNGEEARADCDALGDWAGAGGGHGEVADPSEVDLGVSNNSGDGKARGDVEPPAQMEGYMEGRASGGGDTFIGYTQAQLLALVMKSGEETSKRVPLIQKINRGEITTPQQLFEMGLRVEKGGGRMPVGWAA